LRDAEWPKCWPNGNSIPGCSCAACKTECANNAIFGIDQHRVLALWTRPLLAGISFLEKGGANPLLRPNFDVPEGSGDFDFTIFASAPPPKLA
jgi:hypothetical protein